MAASRRRVDRRRLQALWRYTPAPIALPAVDHARLHGVTRPPETSIRFRRWGSGRARARRRNVATRTPVELNGQRRPELSTGKSGDGRYDRRMFDRSMEKAQEAEMQLSRLSAARSEVAFRSTFNGAAGRLGQDGGLLLARLLGVA